MIYLKSFLAGLAGLTLAGILFPFASCIFTLFFQSQASGAADRAISWDLRTALGSPLFRWAYALTVVSCFVVAFLWEFRRVSR
jgi:hypothetical protein